MTIEADELFGVENGIEIFERENTEGPIITGGADSPLGLDLPIRSTYNQTTAKGVVVWKKFGADINDWALEDRLFDVSKKTYDIKIPAQTTMYFHEEEIDGEVVVDGEQYIV